MLARLAQAAELRSSLGAALDRPLRRPWVDLLAGTSEVGGPWARAEAGVHLMEGLSLVGGGGWNRDAGWGVSGGVHFEF